MQNLFKLWKYCLGKISRLELLRYGVCGLYQELVQANNEKSELRICWGNSPVGGGFTSAGFPHKGPVVWKAISCNVVILKNVFGNANWVLSMLLNPIDMNTRHRNIWHRLNNHKIWVPKMLSYEYDDSQQIGTIHGVCPFQLGLRANTISYCFEAVQHNTILHSAQQLFCQSSTSSTNLTISPFMGDLLVDWYICGTRITVPVHNDAGHQQAHCWISSWAYLLLCFF